MANIPETDIDRLRKWLALNGKAGPKVVNPKNGDLVQVSKDFTGSCYLHGPTVLVAVPSLRFELSHHPHLFGYMLDKSGKLWCRYFWSSLSEGCWRVGTGIDTGRDGRGFRFRKGSYEKISYIYETQVSGELNAFLQAIYSTSPTTLPTGEIDEVAGLKEPKLREFFCDQKNGIFKSYCKEISPKISYPDALDSGLFGTSTSSVGAKGGATYQKDPQAFKMDLKPLHDLWSTLARCLDCPAGGYEHESTLLGSDVVVERFNLAVRQGSIIIEIAHTKNPVSMTFKSKDLALQHTLDAPVCWVKTVYFDGEYSSFGNFKRFPRDLAFLPQKPMDYDVKRSRQVAQSLIDRQGDRYGTGPTPADNQYVLLALFDEKYCPLIQAYKKMRGIPMFKAFSKKAVKVEKALESLRTLFQTKSGDLFHVLQATVLDSCEQYLAGPGNGAKDQRRIEAFQQAVAQCKSLDDLGQVTFDLFARIRVGREAFSGKIETGPTSYLVYFCDALRTGGLVPVDLALNMPGIHVNVEEAEWGGEKKSIIRAILYLWNKQLYSFFNDPDKLEGILGAMGLPHLGSRIAEKSLADFFQDTARVNGLFQTLQAAIVESCDRYKKGPGHGEYGEKRVEAFKAHVSACTSLDELGQAAYDLFKRNKVGSKDFSSLFGGKINTKPTSYIVYFCDALLMGGVVAIDSVIDRPEVKIDPKLPEWSGEPKSIIRAILYIRNAGLFHHFDTQKELEGVLSAMA